MIFGSPPSRATALRIAARSTSSGTPVKSCNTMRATTNGISSLRRLLRVPVRERLDILRADFLAVAIAQDGFEHDADADRQARDFADALLLERGERVEGSFAAEAGVELLQGEKVS